jgi:tetratricopeptide (TPR) repeat protein
MNPTRHLVACFALILALSGPSTSAQEVKTLKGRLLTVEKNLEKQPLKGVVITVLETENNNRTNDLGVFNIKLIPPLLAGQSVTVAVAKKDHVIVNPDLFGKLRLPREAELVEIWVVPKGSKFILADQHLERFLERVSSEAATRSQGPGRAPEPDLAAEVRRLAREAGFTERETLERFQVWAKQAKEHKTDFRKLGLAAFWERNYDLARENFREAARRNEKEAARDWESAGEAALAGMKAADAIEDYGRALKLLDPSRDRQRWLVVRLKRVAALAEFGEYGDPVNSIRALKEAVAVCREDLVSLDRKIESIVWATAQNNLGYALGVLGRREMGAEGVKHLREAVQAYRRALEVRSRKDLPQDWGNTQNSLSIALSALGQREGGAEGIKLLREAIEACRNALEVRSKKELPQSWANTQINLSLPLRALGQREGGAEGVKLLREAAQASRLALEVFTRKDQPQDWARTQVSLGITLSELGQREGGAEGVKLLREAAQAYRLALEVVTRKDHPQDWVQIHTTLADTLSTLADKTSGSERRELLALTASSYQAALTGFTRETHPDAHRSVYRRLGSVEIDLALEVGQWEKATELAGSLVKIAPDVASQVRLTATLLAAGRFEDGLKRFNELGKNRQLRDKPDAATELLMVRLLCQVALGKRSEAAQTVKQLHEHLGRQPQKGHTAGPWLGLIHFLQQTKQKRLVEHRAGLLKCLNALHRESREGVLRTLNSLHFE